MKVIDLYRVPTEYVLWSFSEPVGRIDVTGAFDFQTSKLVKALYLLRQQPYFDQISARALLPLTSGT